MHIRLYRVRPLPLIIIIITITHGKAESNPIFHTNKEQGGYCIKRIYTQPTNEITKATNRKHTEASA
jgi:hypothetical protein